MSLGALCMWNVDRVSWSQLVFPDLLICFKSQVISSSEVHMTDTGFQSKFGLVSDLDW